MNTETQTTNKLIYLENRLQSFKKYICIIWTLLVFSVLGLLASIYELSADETFDNKILNVRKAYIIINFFVNLLHSVGYFYGIQVYTKQNFQMNKIFEYVLIGFCLCNFLYFIYFIFLYHVTLFTWGVDIFYLILNGTLFFQAHEITSIFYEKNNLKNKYDMLLLL